MLAPIPKQPAADMTTMSSPIPFVMWGIDIVGKLPTAKGNITYDIVAVDYFSKWVEAKALISITCDDIKSFLWKNIVNRYGIPKIIVTDNGTQFEGAQLRSSANISTLNIGSHLYAIHKPMGRLRL